ncbi:MAG TPA: hypothetical protein VNJ54_21500 [Plantibacter sp.]|uniref:hypothetical protein n=1 Tax=unclassified Plantibacter TaxID=2624265 RepID=UPI002C988492|nr:hypothetical protein [Plantibacter sp.]
MPETNSHDRSLRALSRRWGSGPSEVFEEATTDYALPLPAGIAWPEALPDEMLAKNVKMEEGVPKTTALFYWLCAWEDNYLTAEKGGDEAQQAQALKMIQQISRRSPTT